MADLVPGGRGAEKPRVFLWEAAAAAVRVVGTSEAPWFVAKDVCAMLEIQNVSQALAALDEDEKGVCNTDTLGGAQDLLTVNESGLYALIFRSRKEQAKVFRKWVTSEVLPQIRKTGAYTVPSALPPPREIVIHQSFQPPEEPATAEALLIELLMEVMAATRDAGPRRGVLVHGRTIFDIACRTGTFDAWMGQSTNDGARFNCFMRNLSVYFGRHLVRPLGFGDQRGAYVYSVFPQGFGRQRRYVIAVRDHQLPADTIARVPEPRAVQIVDAALHAGGEVKVS